MSRAERFLLLKGPEFAFAVGEAVMHVCTGITEDAEIALDASQESGAQITVAGNPDWLADAKPGRVIRYDGTRGVSEWPIKGREDVTGEGSGLTRLTLDPLYAILGDAGPMEVLEAGLVGWSNLGSLAEGISTRNYLTTFALPFLADRGYDYIALGTQGTDRRVTVTADLWTPLQLVIELANQTGQEWDLRRDEGARKYRIDIIPEVGSGAGEAWVVEGVNLSSFRRTRSREDLRTVIRPAGDLPTGGERRADARFNVWTVDSVTNPSGNDWVIVLSDPAGGDGPVAFDDQWADVSRDGSVIHPAAHLENAAGTKYKITASSASADSVTVSNATAPAAVGDRVSLVRDSTGNPLVEVPSPSALTEFGRICGPLELSGRGERNWLPNHGFATWTSKIEIAAGEPDGLQSNTTNIDVINFPANQFIPSGTTLWAGIATTEMEGGPRTVASDVTLSGAGAGTIVVDVAMSIQTGRSVYVSIFDGNLPDDYTAQASQRCAPIYRNNADAFEGSASVATAAAVQAFKLHLKGLTENQVVVAGTRIVEGSTVLAVVLEEGTVNGSGEVTVWITQLNKAGGLSVDDPVTLTQPTLRDADAGSNSLGLLNRGDSVGPGPVFLRTPSMRVEKTFGEESLWVSCGLHLDPYQAKTITDASSPRILVVDEDDSDAVIAEARVVPAGDPNLALTAGEDILRTLRAQYAIQAGETVNIGVLVGGEGPTGGQPIDIITYVGWITVMLSVPERVPPVEGSHANQLIQQANDRLGDVGEWAGTYEMDLVELASVLDVTPATVRASVGASLRLVAPSVDEDVVLRIQGLRFRPAPKGEESPITSVILQRRPDSLTRTTARQRQRTLFARVDIDGVGAQTLIPQEQPPVAATGVPRASATDFELVSNDPVQIKASD